MDYTLSIIRHKDAEESTLERVIAIKQKTWPYPIESQMTWIQSNLRDDDLHVILTHEGRDVAYMNLVNITFTVNNNKEYLAYGIGNVCAAFKGEGYGGELMRQVNAYLRENRFCGLLFCKDGLVPFYKLYDWKEVDHKVCKEPTLPEDIHIMTYLAPEEIFDFKYKGKLF